MGSMEAARRAGASPDKNTVSGMRKAAAAKHLTGSQGATPNSKERSSRPAAIEPSPPTRRPIPAVQALRIGLAALLVVLRAVYSVLRATAGSMEAARRAGISPAKKAARTRVAMAMLRMTGLTPLVS